MEQVAVDQIKDVDLDPVLNAATDEQIRELRRIVDLETDSSDRTDVLEHLNWLSRSTLGYLFAEPKSYLVIVQEICNKHNVKFHKRDGVKELERKIIKKILKDLDKKISSEDRERLIDEAGRMANTAEGKALKAIASAGGFAALAAAKASGFGIYVAATTALGAVTEAAAITAPFWVYTGLSQAIAVALGPAGWIACGLSTVLSLDRPNYKKLLAAILVIAALRSKQEAQRKRWILPKPSIPTMMALVAALVALGALLYFPRNLRDVTLTQDMLLAVPSITSILCAMYGAHHIGSKRKRRVPESPHMLAGGLLMAVGLMHAFTPFPQGLMSLAVFGLALGVLAYNAARLYEVLFGEDIKDEPFVLKRYLGQVDVRLTKQRIFTLLSTSAAISIWSALGSVPFGVSLGCYAVFILIVFYAGERVYEYAGPLLTFLVAGCLLTAAFRNAFLEVIQALGVE